MGINNEMLIYNIMVESFEKKLEKIRVINKDNVNIKNIVEENVISIEKYIKILKDYINKNNNI